MMPTKKGLSLTQPGPHYYFFIFFVLQFIAWITVFYQVLSKTFEISTSVERLSLKTLPSCRLSLSTLGSLDTETIIRQLEEAGASERQALTLRLIEGGLKFGGHSLPIHCKAAAKAAIIVQFREREAHLDIFLRYMHPYLQRKLLDYTIFVIEQTKGLPFNRGSLLNVGFVEALSSDPTFDYIILHDVDMLPEHEKNDYSCPRDMMPRQMAYMVDIWDYEPVQKDYAGGVTAISTKDFVRVNGFSNKFWGWGSEDDDFSRRIRSQNLTLTRITDIDPSMAQYVKYRTLYHMPPKKNGERAQVYYENGGLDNLASDGITSLRYEKKHVQMKPYYTHIVVELSREELHER